MVANPVLILVPLAAIGMFFYTKKQGKSNQQALRDSLLLVIGLYAVFFIIDLFIE